MSKIEGSIHLSKHVEPQAGVQIGGVYRLGEMGLHGQPNQLNVMIDGVTYGSIGVRSASSTRPGRSAARSRRSSRQINVTISGISYRSTGGHVAFEHAAHAGRATQSVRGTFDAQLVPDGDAAVPPLHVTGSFEGQLGVTCHVLAPAKPARVTGAQGGELEGRAHDWPALDAG